MYPSLTPASRPARPQAVYTKTSGGRLLDVSDGPGPAGRLAKARSRRERELASLAPWAWDPKVETHKPGRAMMRDFSEVCPSARGCALCPGVCRPTAPRGAAHTHHPARVCSTRRGPRARGGAQTRVEAAAGGRRSNPHGLTAPSVLVAPVWRRAWQVTGALLPHQPRESVEHAAVQEGGGTAAAGSPPLRAARVAHSAVPPTAGAKRPRPAEEQTPGDVRRRVSSPPPRGKGSVPQATGLSPGTVSPVPGGPASRTPLSVPLPTAGGGQHAHRLHAGITSPVPWPDLEGGRGAAHAAWASPYSVVAPASRPVGVTSPLCVLADAATDENAPPGHHGPHKHPLGTAPQAPVVATVTKPRSSMSAGAAGGVPAFGASPRPADKNAAAGLMSPSPAALAAAAQCVRVRPAPQRYSAVPSVWRLGPHAGGPGQGFIRRSDGGLSTAMPPPPAPQHGSSALSPALMNGFARLHQLRAHSSDPALAAVA